MIRLLKLFFIIFFLSAFHSCSLNVNHAGTFESLICRKWILYKIKRDSGTIKENYSTYIFYKDQKVTKERLVIEDRAGHLAGQPQIVTQEGVWDYNSNNRILTITYIGGIQQIMEVITLRNTKLICRARHKEVGNFTYYFKSLNER